MCVNDFSHYFLYYLAVEMQKMQVGNNLLWAAFPLIEIM